MKNYFKKAFNMFKYCCILFTILFWIYMIYDDYIFIEKYGITLKLIGMWFLWYIVYFIGFAFYYWGIISTIILINNKIIQRKKMKYH